MHDGALSHRRHYCAGAAGVPGGRPTQTGAVLMTLNGYLQIVLYMIILIGLAKPLGTYMARVYEGQSIGLDRVLGPVERLIYRICGMREDQEMNWKTYVIAMLLFNLLGFLV